jgi:hypothetical protein
LPLSLAELELKVELTGAEAEQRKQKHDQKPESPVPVRPSINPSTDQPVNRPLFLP